MEPSAAPTSTTFDRMRERVGGGVHVPRDSHHAFGAEPTAGCWAGPAPGCWFVVDRFARHRPLALVIGREPWA